MLVQDFLKNSAERLPDKVCLIHNDQRMTYRQINYFADKLAAALIDVGVKHQDRVAIFLENSVETVITIFGILKAGAVFLIANPTMKAKKLAYILNDSGAFVLVASSNKSTLINETVKNNSSLKHIVWCGGVKKEVGVTSTHSGIEMHVWPTFIKSTNRVSKNHQPDYRDADLASIIYTSGSTGKPKGIMCAHCNMVAAAQSISSYLDNSENDIILNVLPFSFDYGLYQVLMTFMFGGTIVLEESFVYPNKIRALLIKESVTGLPIVPTIAAILANIGTFPKSGFPNLRYITSTADVLSFAHIETLQRIFPKAKIFSMYGLTECKRVSYLPPEDICRKPNSVGIPIPNEEVKIVNDKGHEAGPHEIGELIVRGPNVMQGYWNDAVETARVFHKKKNKNEIWLYTGDLFKKDEEGYLYFVGRKDDLIKVKGERISPKEIEQTLCEIEGVMTAAVIGIPDTLFGKKIKAYIVLQKKSQLNTKQIMSYCSQNLEPFMVPSFIEFCHTLPLLPNGKIDRRKLQQNQ